MPYLPFSFLLCLASLLLVSHAASVVSNPLPDDFFTLGLIQNEASCPYTVIISTSCLSPDFTEDQISIAFGDSDGNQVLVPRLDDPYSTTTTFKKCSSDTFQLAGPCTNKICYVYLHRDGLDGWLPESVTIFSQTSKAVKFNINTTTPDNIWFGTNYCTNTSPPSPPPPYLPPFAPQSQPSPAPLPPTPASLPPPPPSTSPPAKTPPPPPYSSSYHQDAHLGVAVLAGLGLGVLLTTLA